MNILSSFLVAAGLSMDNMAVTLCAGCSLYGSKRLRWQISLLFALAHFMMFSIGYEGGVLVHAGRKVGAWVACLILVCIGGRMWKHARETTLQEPPLFTSISAQLSLAVATSIDALFVGAGMGLAQTPFWQTVLFITGCVFVTSLCGFYIGQFLGKQVGPRMERVGGVVLVLLGGKVLLEGLGIL